jgi:hypothetical protein
MVLGMGKGVLGEGAGPLEVQDEEADIGGSGVAQADAVLGVFEEAGEDLEAVEDDVD